MPNLNTTNLENLANLTFQDFVALHQQGQNRAHVYYTALKQEAETAGLLHVENYADLAQSVGLDWGGNWVSFRDIPHYQVKTGKKIAAVRGLFESGTPYI